MKIKVDCRKLLEKFQFAGSVVSSSVVNPLYKNVRVEARDGKVIITATALEVGIKTTLSSGVVEEEPGVVLMPEQNVSAILRSTPDEQVEIVADDTSVQLITSDSSFRFPVEGLEDFVDMTDITEEKGILELDQAALTTAMKQTVFAIAEDRDRYTLNGVYLKVKDNTIDFVGADGNRMALVKQKVVNEGSVEGQSIIPRKGAEQLMKLAAASDSPVKIRIEENQIIAWNDEARLSSVLLEGQYPDYEKIISKDAEAKLEINRARLLSVVQRAALVLTPESLAVSFMFEKGKLTLQSESPELGSAKLTMPVDFEGKAFSAIFNPEYIEDFLKVAERETVLFDYFGKKKPATFRTGRNYIYLVMPISIEERVQG